MNSKNDESEALISNIKSQYDEERDQLINDTNKKLDEYKFRLMSLNDQTITKRRGGAVPY